MHKTYHRPVPLRCRCNQAWVRVYLRSCLPVALNRSTLAARPPPKHPRTSKGHSQRRRQLQRPSDPGGRDCPPHHLLPSAEEPSGSFQQVSVPRIPCFPHPHQHLAGLWNGRNSHLQRSKLANRQPQQESQHRGGKFRQPGALPLVHRKLAERSELGAEVTDHSCIPRQRVGLLPGVC